MDDADEETKALMARGLHVGIVVDESADEFRRGDFLVRAFSEPTMVWVPSELGTAPIGTTLQFHVRDAETATEDLESLLRVVDADAALVFTCNGRGHRLFGEADHDARRAPMPSAGVRWPACFAPGKLVPSVARIMHGFTASTLFLFG